MAAPSADLGQLLWWCHTRSSGAVFPLRMRCFTAATRTMKNSSDWTPRWSRTEPLQQRMVVSPASSRTRREREAAAPGSGTARACSCVFGPREASAWSGLPEHESHTEDLGKAGPTGRACETLHRHRLRLPPPGTTRPLPDEPTREPCAGVGVERIGHSEYGAIVLTRTRASRSRASRKVGLQGVARR